MQQNGLTNNDMGNVYPYTIKNEQSLAEVARVNGCSEFSLYEHNKWANRSLRRGDVVHVPTTACPNGDFVRWQNGASLYDMAVHYGATEEEFLQANPGLSIERAMGGQVVVAPTTSGEMHTERYRVQVGDYLGDILRRYSVGLPMLRRLNPEADLFNLEEGMMLTVPTPYESATQGNYYTLEKGEDLLSVADKLGVTPIVLLQANSSLLPQEFRAGQRIVLP